MEDPLFDDHIFVASQLAALPHPKGERLAHAEPAFGIAYQDVLWPFLLVGPFSAVLGLFLFVPLLGSRYCKRTQEQIMCLDHLSNLIVIFLATPLPSACPRQSVFRACPVIST